MAKSKASRKYLLTINNPEKHGFSHNVIISTLSTFKGISYWCLCDEIGAEGTPHTHIYFYSPNAILFETVLQRFHGAHIDPAKGSHRENRDYIRKEGRYLDDPKHDTNLIDTFVESGLLPEESNKRETQSSEILSMLKDGASDLEIINRFPSSMNHIQHVHETRQLLMQERFRSEWRELNVTYIWGKTGVGKTRKVMEEFGYENVYRVSNYAHPFDQYQGEDVVLFDEFRSSLPITEMLNYLDGYPLSLPCRYNDKVACYTKVFVISNIPISKQYPNVQFDEPETYNAFCRRFHSVFELAASNGDPF